jgi:hypothetical protein
VEGGVCWSGDVIAWAHMMGPQVGAEATVLSEGWGGEDSTVAACHAAGGVDWGGGGGGGGRGGEQALDALLQSRAEGSDIR